ncbi:hypothetical protein [Streptomyces achromogenes]|uniref:hypothetical protein n=1 Tax=Streptomyces achromogenes TaxID=67255 RepID=UPI003A7F7BD3
MNAVEIIEPGRYDYNLTVKFPSVYIPEHTAPEFRNDDAYETTRTRYTSGQFDLAEHAGRNVIRDHFVRQVRDDLLGADVEVTEFTLTRVDTTGDAR